MTKIEKKIFSAIARVQKFRAGIFGITSSVLKRYSECSFSFLIKRYINGKKKTNAMIRKAIFIGWIVLVVLIIGAVVYINLPRTPGVQYSTNPETWVTEDPATGVKEVDFDKVTEGKSYFNDINQQYRDGEIFTVFGYDGIYQGNFFETTYFDEEGNIKMQITGDLIPNDGVLQGILVEKIEEGIPFTYIFLDEDWKNTVNPVNIVWGETYQNEKPFEFKEIKPGIYMDKIQDDISRFTDNFNGMSFGGVVVGNVDKEDILAGNTDVTIMSLH